MEKNIVDDEKTSLRCKQNLGKFPLWFLMTFYVVQTETMDTFRLLLNIVAVKITSLELTCLLRNVLYS